MWWFLYGLIVGGGAMRMIVWVQNENILVSWYGWLIAALTLILITLTAQHFFASYKELEPKAAWMGVLVMGIPALILTGVTSWLFLTF